MAIPAKCQRQIWVDIVGDVCFINKNNKKVLVAVIVILIIGVVVILDNNKEKLIRKHKLKILDIL